MHRRNSGSASVWWSLGAGAALLLTACGSGSAPTVSSTAGTAPVGADSYFKPTATFQEIMDSVVDPAADYAWQAVASILDKHGEVDRQPRTEQEWHEFRRHAILLAEAANLIAVPGRKVAVGTRTIENREDLDVAGIQSRLDGDHAALVGFAGALRVVALKLVDAADRRDVGAVSDIGSELDDVCEACHQVFWYPPSAPATQSAAPASRAGR